MRIVVAVISIALFISCSTELSKQQMVTATSLTLKMEETQIDGEPSATLLLCEKEKCINPLRDKSGRDFHFRNYADLYNEKVKEEGKGQTIKMALLSITMAATFAGAALYIKSDAMRIKISDLKDSIKDLKDEIFKAHKKLDKMIRENKFEEIEKTKKELTELEAKKEADKINKQKLEKIDKYVAPSYWVALGLSAVGANAIAFAPGIAEDTLWQDNKRALADLFIHGSEVKVTKDELIDLFAIVVDQVNATVDVAVQSYLFGI